MAVIRGTAANEIVDPDFVSPTVTGGFPSADPDDIAMEGGDDDVNAGAGNDTVDLGAGNDLFRWSINDDFDTLQGGDGFDEMIISPGSANEFLRFGISLPASFEYFLGPFPAPLEGEVRFSGIERIRVLPSGGDDDVRIGLFGLQNSGLQQLVLEDNAPVQISGTGQSNSFVALPAIDGLLLQAGPVQISIAAGADVVLFGQQGDDLFNMGGYDGGPLAIFGDDGSDLMRPGPSAETLNGATLMGTDVVGAIDTLDYSSSPAAIFLLLETSTGRGFGGWAQEDSFTNIERFVGSSFDDYASLAFNTATEFFGGNGDDQAFGGAAANRFFGEAGNDRLDGGGGNDLLDGGTGADVMRGGPGNDTMMVDNAADQVFERIGEGDDVVVVNASFTLAAGVEVETITNMTAANLTLTGNEFGQSIFGNAGLNVLNGGGGNDQLLGFGDNDVLVGGTGADVLRGGTGNDSYNVDNAGDLVFENVGEGDDSVFTSVSFILTAGAQVENLGTTSPSGTGAINLTGNEFGQSLFGNAGNNVLVGAGGADNMTGFAGNDSYNVDNAGDQVFEGAGEGDDAVFASVSFTLTAGAQVENLGTTNPSGTGAINLTGNDFAQSIFGNNGANVLNGDGGHDNISGLDGNDFLNGGNGNDVLNGGAGGDEHRFTTNLNAATNVDTIIGYTPFADGVALDDAVFTALSPGSLPAGAFRTGTAAQDADDRIIYNNATGQLFYDADGNGAGAQVLFATLQGAPAISNNDFIVI